ncbi:MAG: iron-sulfur cluster assembly accessory protein [Gemmatimonadales bacterium]|jgi:iron-sulfur cluster assembly protein|nr:iron-sulfur cluster assembly accessory protein [Gemmatimonadales bacterium]MDZ4389896.1 iron-sulfur cluster assembly accessory protein [Gemmatimonadales bacterium]
MSETLTQTQTQALPEGFVLTLTDQAAAEVRKFLAAEDVPQATAGLRISVLPGGCSGFKYSLNIEDKPVDDDMTAELNGVRIFIDAFSAQYLSGITIDYVTSMQGSGFTFNNPNATGGCGCGSSFTA